MTDDRRYRYTAKDEYDNMSFDFWCKWLLLVSILFMIFGLIIALFPDSPLFALHTAALERAFFNSTMPEAAAHLRGFLFSPLGGTIAGYFLLQAFVVWGPFRRRERWAWHAVLCSMLLWFVVDSGMSVYHGAFFNVWMINLWSLLLVGLPLMVTRRAFRKESPPSVSPPVPGERAGFRYFSTHQ